MSDLGLHCSLRTIQIPRIFTVDPDQTDPKADLLVTTCRYSSMILAVAISHSQKSPGSSVG